MSSPTDRERIAWMYRRAGFGPAAGQLDLLEGGGLAAALDAFVDPGAHGAPEPPDPWGAIDLSDYDKKIGDRKGNAVLAIRAWLVAMATTPRPFEEWMRWFWHGHFVSTIRATKNPRLMVQQMGMFGRYGLGDFRTLLREVTIDPAMLVYLDGTTNQATKVNENYGREVLELFALGVGNYTEADVRAGAEALSGWWVNRDRSPTEPLVATFTEKIHDDRPKDYLGRSGVHDLDTVIDAIIAHPACAPFVTAKLAKAILGPDVDPGLVTSLAKDFVASGMQIRPLARAILEAGLDSTASASRSLVQAPVPWLVAMVKATGLPADAAMKGVGAKGLVTAGQVPMDAPNVAGWPGGRAWLSSSATVARFNIATGLAAAAPADGAARTAAAARDVRALADALGYPGGFSPATQQALLGATPDTKAISILALAMASPDLALA